MGLFALREHVVDDRSDDRVDRRRTTHQLTYRRFGVWQPDSVTGCNFHDPHEPDILVRKATASEALAAAVKIALLSDLSSVSQFAT